MEDKQIKCNKMKKHKIEQDMIDDNTLGIGEWDHNNVLDLSITLTDKILNNFENYISKRDRKFYKGVKNIEKEIPLLIETKEEPHIKIWFDDEKGNRGSFYSWELQDLITDVLCKNFNIKEEE